MKNHYFLDFETTGLDQYHEEVIEIGIKKFGEENEYTTLVVPENENGFHYKYVSEKITEVTGITDKDIIEHGISQEEGAFGMYKYIVDTYDEGPIYLIAHNGISFDFIFLGYWLINTSQLKLRTRSTSIDLDIINRFRYHDTLLMARYLIPNDE